MESWLRRVLVDVAQTAAVKVTAGPAQGPQYLLGVCPWGVHVWKVCSSRWHSQYLKDGTLWEALRLLRSCPEGNWGILSPLFPFTPWVTMPETLFLQEFLPCSSKVFCLARRPKAVRPINHRLELPFQCAFSWTVKYSKYLVTVKDSCLTQTRRATCSPAFHRREEKAKT